MIDPIKAGAAKIEAMRSALDYNPATGRLIWRYRSAEMFATTGKGGARAIAASWNTRFAGKEALVQTDKDGYLFGIIFDKRWLAHRAAWVIFYGEMPPSEIDHKNRIPHDNRIENLRLASPSENKRNRSPWANGSSKYLGVSRCRWSRPWQAGIQHGGVSVHLGSYALEVDAAKAYDCAARQLHGSFARPNFPAETDEFVLPLDAQAALLSIVRDRARKGGLV